MGQGASFQFQLHKARGALSGATAAGACNVCDRQRCRGEGLDDPISQAVILCACAFRRIERKGGVKSDCGIFDLRAYRFKNIFGVAYQCCALSQQSVCASCTPVERRTWDSHHFAALLTGHAGGDK